MGHPEEQKTLYTFEEYLELEAVSEDRHEYHFGEIYALAGGTMRHYRLAKRVIDALEAQAGDKPCVVVGSDIKLELVKKGKYVYPDLAMTCDWSDLGDDQKTIIRRPVLIGEVLSKATEAYDRNEKFKRYIKIPSLKYYLLISQYSYQVECFSRQTHDFWHYRSYTEPGAVVELTELDCRLELDAIYRGFSLAEQEPGDGSGESEV